MASIIPSARGSSSLASSSSANSSQSSKKSSCSRLTLIGLGTIVALSGYFIGKTLYNRQICRASDQQFGQDFELIFSRNVESIELGEAAIKKLEKELLNQELTPKDRKKLENKLEREKQLSSKAAYKCRAEIIHQVMQRELNQPNHCRSEDFFRCQKTESNKYHCYYRYLNDVFGSKDHPQYALSQRAKQACLKSKDRGSLKH